MAAAHLLGYSLEPRIADLGDQTLYKIDREAAYPGLDPILTGTVKTHLIGPAWDGVVRLVASMRARTASPSLILHRLGSYARQNSLHRAFAEIGRVRKTAFVLRFLDDAAYRRRIGQELNKGERSHALSRFLFFGKEGAARGRSFQDQVKHLLLPGRAAQRRGGLEHAAARRSRRRPARRGTRHPRPRARSHIAAAARPHQPFRAVPLRPGPDAPGLTRVFRPMWPHPVLCASPSFSTAQFFLCARKRSSTRPRR